MATIQDVATQLRKLMASAKHATTLTGYTVAVTQVDDAGTSYTTPRDIERTNHIYVQIGGQATAPISVWNIGPSAVDYKENIQVDLDYNRSRELQVIGADATLADAMYGEVANTVLQPELAGELRKEIIPGWRFKPLRVRINDTSSLNVVIEPGVYDYGNGSYAWESVTPIDLADVTVSSGYKVAIIVGIDPATNAAVTASGTERVIPLPDMTLTDYVAVRNDNPGKIWLFGYMRKDGVTAFTSIYDLVDIRAYVGASGIAGNASFMPQDLDFNLEIPYNTQVPIRRLNITTGVLTVNGVLDVF